MTERYAESAHLTDDQLRTRAGDCTELSCLYHGAFNIELMRRREVRTPPKEGRDA